MNDEMVLTECSKKPIHSLEGIILSSLCNGKDSSETSEDLIKKSIEMFKEEDDTTFDKVICCREYKLNDKKMTCICLKRNPELSFNEEDYLLQWYIWEENPVASGFIDTIPHDEVVMFCYIPDNIINKDKSIEEIALLKNNEVKNEKK